MFGLTETQLLLWIWEQEGNSFQWATKQQASYFSQIPLITVSLVISTVLRGGKMEHISTASESKTIFFEMFTHN